MDQHPLIQSINTVSRIQQSKSHGSIFNRKISRYQNLEVNREADEFDQLREESSLDSEITARVKIENEHN